MKNLKTTALALGLVSIAAAATPLFTSQTICFPGGVTATVITVCGEVDDQNGSSLSGGAVMSVEHHPKGQVVGSSADVIAGVDGYLDADFAIASFDPSRLLYVSVWTGAAEGDRFTRESVFLSQLAGAAFFKKVPADLQSGCYKIPIDGEQAAEPPSIGEIDLVGIPGSELTVHMEDLNLGTDPVDSLVAIAGAVPQGQSLFKLYSWSDRSAWRVSLRDEDGVAWAKGVLRRGATLQLDVTGKGAVDGSVDFTSYPNGKFVVVHKTSNPIPTDLVLQMERMLTLRQCDVSTSAFSFDALNAGDYTVELWDKINSSAPEATALVTIHAGATATVDFQ